jgi:cytochrome P450
MNTSSETKPTPVPLVPDLAGCPYAAYARLREQGGVHQARKPSGDVVWLVSRHVDVKALMSDARGMSMNAASSRHGYHGYGLPPALDQHLLNLDAPDHTRLRRLAGVAFTPRRVQDLAPRVQAIANKLIDQLPADGHVDLVDVYAAPLPVTVICELLGVRPEDGEAFHANTSALMRRPGPGRPSTSEIVGNLHRLLVDLIAAKRAQPADDLLSALIDARDSDGDRLDEDELTSLAFITLWAGYENSVRQIANAAAALLEHPDQLDHIRHQPTSDSPAMHTATEELLRYTGSMLTGIRRFPLVDYPIGGQVLPAGDTVLPALTSANRDPDVFDEPDTLDLSRADNPHLTLGVGPHYCLGAPLARLELRVGIWTLIHRLPNLTLDIPGDQLPWINDYRQHALASLPVRYQPQPGG